MDYREIKERIEANNIDTLRVEFSDMYGVNRGKIVPASRLEALLEEGINCAKPTFSLDLNYTIPPGTGTAEEVNYRDMTIIPDPDTFAVIPYQTNTARFIGDIYADGKPFPYSPRWLLKKVVEKYKDKGLVPITATELEFFLFQPGEDSPEYYVDKPSNVYTIGPRVDPLDLLRQLQNIFLDLGLDVLYANHEFFQSQYEINWKHADALTIADQTFTFKSVCKDVAAINKLMLTFMARPKDELGGSGYHMHFSINDAQSGKNLFDDPGASEGISDMMRHFIGGQMAHAKGMTPFFAPTVNCYKRYMLNSFAAYYLAWGLDNRSTYIRVPDERGMATRVENRAGSAAANPYLMTALGLIAGLDGIEKKLDPGAYYEGDLYAEDPTAYDTVPLYLHEAITALQEDAVLCEALGPEIVHNYTAVKLNEAERFRCHVTDWEFSEYSYHL